MIFDTERIVKRTEFIRDNLVLLNELARYSEAEFLADKRNYYTAIHALQVSVEAMLDVFTHIVARMHLGAPADDRETLEVILKKGLISQDNHQRYFKMNKFRNKVVHGYLDLDAKKIYQMLHEDLADFDLFFADAKRIIEREEARKKGSNNKKSNAKK